MAIVLEINNLSYMKFSNINLSFSDHTYYSIIGSNKSGKTMLFKLISGLIPSNNSIACNSVNLDLNSISDYITNIGVVDRVNEKSFIYQKVIDEMLYPLHNLGFGRNNGLTRIKEVLSLFKSDGLLNKNINELDYYEKELLLIMIALLHEPSVLLLDSVLEIFPNDMKKRIIKVLRKLVKEGLTVINFTNSLEDAYNSDKIILLDNYEVIGEYTPKDIYNNDKLFYEHNLEIPFLVDLSIKLKMYNLVDKEYSKMEAMVDDIWP